MLPEKAVLKLGVDICSALEICAMKKVIHRDIKPENIFINEFGDYKLGDFGVARKLENVAGALSQKGTYNYMAPEVEKGTSYNETVDLYSLGLVLYRFLNRKTS
ncbi:MAG: protein kinase [Lachnospiraceae bacterium]|nr:protein kinase [Lachnospiraceae bacterium]